MNAKNKRAVIYARVSSENDRQDTSRQITDIQKFREAQDMEIVKIYEEHSSGAKKNEERQVLTECLDYCTKNHVDYLLLSELSRLGRSTLQVLKSLEQLHEAKVSVYIQNLGLYSLQPNGEVNPIASILITVLAEMGNIERYNPQNEMLLFRVPSPQRKNASDFSGAFSFSPCCFKRSNQTSHSRRHQAAGVCVPGCSRICVRCQGSALCFSEANLSAEP